MKTAFKSFDLHYFSVMYTYSCDIKFWKHCKENGKVLRKLSLSEI